MKKLLAILCASVLGFAAQSARADKVDFAKQVRPIFAESCYKCHGSEKQKGDYRLDMVAGEKGMMKKPEKPADPTAIVAGNPDKSDLVRRITLKHDDEDAMPPDGKGDALKAEQIALIKQWITEGADFGGWTEDKTKAAAPVAIVLPTVPPAKAEDLAKLHEVGALAMPLARDTNLIQVNFRAEADKIGDSQLALLAPVAEQVMDLNLAATKVSDAGMTSLKGLKNLRVLHLEKTAISDAGVASLTGLPELRYLNLYGTKVTDAALASIKAMPKLEKVYLWDSKVTEPAVDALKKEKPTLQIIAGFEKPAPPPAAAPAAPGAKPAAPVAGGDDAAKKLLATFLTFKADFKPGGCCFKACKAGEVCEHPCCKEALAAGHVCTKCNPPGAAKKK